MDAMRSTRSLSDGELRSPAGTGQSSIFSTQAYHSLPACDAWNEMSKAAAEAEVKAQLGEFPKRMMASPLVEGKLFSYAFQSIQELGFGCVEFIVVAFGTHE